MATGFKRALTVDEVEQAHTLIGLRGRLQGTLAYLKEIENDLARPRSHFLVSAIEDNLIRGNALDILAEKAIGYIAEDAKGELAIVEAKLRDLEVLL